VGDGLRELLDDALVVELLLNGALQYDDFHVLGHVVEQHGNRGLAKAL